MTKNIFMLTLLIYSCSSYNDKTEAKRNTESQMENEKLPIKKTSDRQIVDSSFLSFWKEFSMVVKAKNHSGFKSMSLNNIKYLEKDTDIDRFIKAHFSEVFDDSLVNKFTNIEKIDIFEDEIDANEIFLNAKAGKYLVQKVIIDKLYNPDLVIIELKFVRTMSGYKFYRYDRFG